MYVSYLHYIKYCKFFKDYLFIFLLTFFLILVVHTGHPANKQPAPALRHLYLHLAPNKEPPIGLSHKLPNKLNKRHFRRNKITQATTLISILLSKLKSRQ